jgi:hypothetical protein
MLLPDSVASAAAGRAAGALRCMRCNSHVYEVCGPGGAAPLPANAHRAHVPQQVWQVSSTVAEEHAEFCNPCMQQVCLPGGFVR